MLIKLKEKNRASLYEYLSKESAINTFIIGDVDNFGFDSESQDLWADINEKGDYKAVILRYTKHFMVYRTEEYDVDAFIKIMQSFEVSDVSGKEDIINEIKSYIDVKNIKEQYFCQLTKENFKNIDTSGYCVRKANIDDIEAMCNLRDKIKEFSKITPDSIRSSVDGKSGRTFLISKGDEVVTMASSSAETDYSAMVVNVCTSPIKRGEGLATVCVSKLCEEVLSESKELCLFYDNPKAGSIYRKLGFKDVGKWTSLLL